MALIKCPECGKEISDKAVACPSCGFPIAKASDSVPDEQTLEPVEQIEPVAPVEMQPENGASVAAAPSKRKFPLAGGIALALVAVVAIVAVFFFWRQQTRATYISNLNDVAYTMLTGGSYAETACNLTKSVWHDTIYEDYNIDTYEYTHDSNYRYYDDFNDAISELYSSSEMAGYLGKISDSKDSVDSLLKELSNPPKDLENCYNAVYDLYSYYVTFTTLAESPSGSYLTYSEDVNDCDSDFITSYNTLLSLIPEK